MMKIEVREDGKDTRMTSVEMTGTTEGLLLDLVCASTSILIKLMQDGVLAPDVDSVTENIRNLTRERLRQDLNKFVKPGMGTDDPREGLTQ